MFMLHCWPGFFPWHYIRSPEHSQRKTSALSGEALKQTNEKSNISFNNVVPEREHCRSSCIKDAAGQCWAIPMWLVPSVWPLDSFRGWVMHLYVALLLFLGRSNRRKHSSRAGPLSWGAHLGREDSAWPSLLWGRLMPGPGGYSQVIFSNQELWKGPQSGGTCGNLWRPLLVPVVCCCRTQTCLCLQGKRLWWGSIVQ